MKTKTWFCTIVGIVALLSASCTPTAEQGSAPHLTFEAPIAINADQVFHVSLGVHNAGTEDFAADGSFEGQMEIRDPSGMLCASAQVLELPVIPAGDTAWPLDWRGELAPDAYRLTWGSDAYGFTTVEFTIVERNGRLYPAEDAPPEEPTEAERLTTQAVADLASRLGIDADQIVVQRVTPTEFPDTSLDAPEPGVTYAQVVRPGYVIQLKIDDQAYEYHAAGDRVVLATGQADAQSPPTPTSDWPVFSDETYGFRLAYPQDWMNKDLNPQGAGTPDDWPIEQVVIFYPQAWADRFEHSGPPDPDAPPAIPTLSLEICVGSEEQFRRAYVAPDRSETLTINGIDAVREEIGTGKYVIVRYVFQDPGNSDVRVVLVDNFSGFTDRAAEHPEIVERIPVVIATFEFAR